MVDVFLDQVKMIASGDCQYFSPRLDATPPKHVISIQIETSRENDVFKLWFTTQPIHSRRVSDLDYHELTKTFNKDYIGRGVWLIDSPAEVHVATAIAIEYLGIVARYGNIIGTSEPSKPYETVCTLAFQAH